MRVVRARSRSLLGLVAAFVFAVTWIAVFPMPAFACKCAPTTIGALDPTENQVYAGIAGTASSAGTPMTVTRWYSGPGEAPTVELAASSFGDSASCGIEPLPVGSQWIMSAYVGESGAQPTTGQCQPHAQLGTPEGAAMLAEAEAAFGPGTVPDAAPPSEGENVTVGLLLVALVVILTLVGAAAYLAVRRDRADHDAA